jgi:cytidine deaminase
LGDQDQVPTQINRFLRLILGDQTLTPTRDEWGMHAAASAALRSGDLSRQVGAAIASKKGSIVALGMNEVPRYGGGAYWAGDIGCKRDIEKRYDSNARLKEHILADLLEVLGKAGLLNESLSEERGSALFRRVMGSDACSAIKRSDLMSIIEFSRAVHAEMQALMDAAYRGVPVAGCTLYSTTFPCHTCGKHIVASGISRVVFIEPYPKSRVSELLADSVSIEEQRAADESTLVFEPFVGVAPRKYRQLFSMTERKTADGALREWSPEAAHPRALRSFHWYIKLEEPIIRVLGEIGQQHQWLHLGREETDG